MKTTTGSIELGAIKRCYAKGAVASIKCPTCGNDIERDLGGDYLSYPVIGEEIDLSIICFDCEESEQDVFEFSVKAKIKSASLTLEYDDENITSY